MSGGVQFFPNFFSFFVDPLTPNIFGRFVANLNSGWGLFLLAIVFFFSAAFFDAIPPLLPRVQLVFLVFFSFLTGSDTPGDIAVTCDNQ